MSTIPASEPVALPAGAVEADAEWSLNRQNRTVRWFYGRDHGDPVMVRQWGVQEYGGTVLARYIELDPTNVNFERMTAADARHLACALMSAAADLDDAEGAGRGGP